VDWGLTFGTLPTRPAFEAYASRLRERPAYKRQKELDGALIAQMKKPA
jgi:glutathione S-transferase